MCIINIKYLLNKKFEMSKKKWIKIGTANKNLVNFE